MYRQNKFVKWAACLQYWLCTFGILPVVLGVSGCGIRTMAWAEKVSISSTKMPTECGGWEEIELKKRTRYYLMQHDPRLAVSVDSHNLRGRQLGCWQ